VKRRSAPETASHHDAITVSGATVTGRTKDVVAVATASHYILSDWKRKRINVVGIGIRTRDSAS
jgi:6,7-dimethyl-8-ribityllumazine synthase